MSVKAPVYGLLAEFDNPARLIAAIRCARLDGYEQLEAYTPIPVEGVHEALKRRRTRLPWLVFLGGLFGAIGGHFLQYYTNVIDYPLNVGGRPLNSWPAFLMVTFEVTVLLAALAAVVGMLALNGLPRLHHPVFNVPEFALASRNRFFLCVRAADIRFDLDRTRSLLAELEPLGIWEVPP